MKNIPQYIYHNVNVVRVIDGDTLVLEIDLGFGLTYKDTFRLNRINAPEIKGKQRELGLKVKYYIEARFGIYSSPDESNYSLKDISDYITKIQTFKKGKYGRYLCEVWVGGKNLSDELVEKKLAWYQDY